MVQLIYISKGDLKVKNLNFHNENCFLQKKRIINHCLKLYKKAASCESFIEIS